MNSPARVASILCLCLALTSCSSEQDKPITIAINPWPGYEFLYLAEQQGFFRQVDANITLVQLGSLADTQRAYAHSRVDGLTSTLIEAVQATTLGGKPLKVILIPDYSNGGDVIVADTRIGNMLGLKGKRIGCEVSSLGIYILQRALLKAGLSLDDVDLVNIEQSQGAASLEAGDIDAFVTYPPASIGILQQTRYHALFSSSEIPYEIIDTLSLSVEVLEANPGIVPKIHQAWQMALDFTADHPEKAYEIMSQREGISSDDFRDALSDLFVLNREEQYKLFHDPEKLDAIIDQTCHTLVQVNNINVDCQALPSIIYAGKL